MECTGMGDLKKESAKAAYIVGIGASAGGLNALELFFDNMQPDSGMAFVVVQHLSPDFKSLMSDLLSRRTSMAVHRVTDGLAIEANQIYLIPPKTQMTVRDEKLYLTERVAGQHLELPIDVFFHSLATDAGSRAIAVVLSGTGSDGSRGVRSIRQNGGAVIVQSPDSSQFDGMPRNAIASGVCDFVLPADRIPAFLVEYTDGQPAKRARMHNELQVFEDEGEYAEIFALLRRSYNLDFSKYKLATVGRRIVRRMEFRQIPGASDYATIISGDPEELEALYKDLLIGVTEFFRDRQSFRFLEEEAIPQLFLNLAPDEDMRIWSAPCATGEEAYSLAILFAEHAGRIGFTGKVTVFATDVHKSSLETASQGIYERERLANVSHQRLERFFRRDGDRFRVTADLRKMVVFAPHNLLNDPPFTRLDLVCCRNLLIYFLPQVQEKVISLFHFALKKECLLFLGSSESLGPFAAEFETVAPQHKLFRKLRDLRLAIDFPPVRPAKDRRPTAPIPTLPQLRAGAPDRQIVHDYDLLLRKHLPAGVLIDEHRQIVHYFGDAARFLKAPEGRVERDLLALSGENLQIVLGSALLTAAKTGRSVVTRNVRIDRGNEELLCEVTVDPLPDEKSRTVHYHISFQAVREAGAGAAEPSSGSPVEPALDPDGREFLDGYRRRVQELEIELHTSRENHQTTMEELQTTNEELQASNEEMLATNEELQSTNEELHSVNEELYSVNSEFERKNLELLQLTTDYDNLLASTDIGTVFLDRQMRIRNFNPAIADFFQLLPQDIGRPIDHLACRIADREEMLADIQAVLDGGPPVERERSTGACSWLLMRIMPFRSETGQVEGAVLTFTDISRIKEALEQKRILAKVFEHSGEALVITDADNRIIAVNGSFSRLTGYSPEDAIGQDPKILKSGREGGEFYAALWESLLTRDYWQGEIWDKRKDGSLYPKWLTITVLRDPRGEVANYIAGFSDISERKLAAQKIEHLAHHDPLTALANRFSLGERLAQALEQAKREGYHLAVLFIDLDRFKFINDSLGHEIGDLLLIEAARRLEASVRESDIVARFGGDEFVVVLPHVKSGIAAAHVVDLIREALSVPYLLNGREVLNTTSIGVSVFPHDGDSVQALMKNADTAMYHAKSLGGGNYQFFRVQMHTVAHERLQLENDLRLAAGRREFLLHYQPQIDVASGRVVGVEALARWLHPEKGMIAPDTFIPLAEESGLILSIGETILKIACRQLAAWIAEGVPPVRMAVNLSARQFRQSTLPDTVAELARGAGIDPALLEVEVTESTSMEEPEETIRQLHLLKGMGLDISIDDFGTGYSSLSYLKHFPVDRLKIDRSFVAGIGGGDGDEAIVAATIALAHTLGRTVTAEGVETKEQLDFLARQHCDQVQGYFFSRPLPADEAAAFIRRTGVVKKR